MSDPRFTDPRLSDPVVRREERVGGTWGWVAGLAVVALVAFLVIAGWNGNSNNTVNNVSPSTLNPPTTTGGLSPSPMSPRTTTGSGATSPQPEAPAEPLSPPKSGAQ